MKPSDEGKKKKEGTQTVHRVQPTTTEGKAEKKKKDLYGGT